MRLLLVSDAWPPQINGVVRTLTRVVQELRASGHDVEVISPDRFRNVPCPTYREIRLALAHPGAVGRLVESVRPDALHIATEGPLGLSARRFCLSRGLAFTTSYHTRFPEYLAARAPIPLAWSYAWMRRFHRPSRGVMVATQSLAKELAARGFRRIVPWTRGVDTELFRPRPASNSGDPFAGLPRPVCLYVGRVAVEKNIEAFLAMDLAQGCKVVVGDGPQRAELMARYPKVRFLGVREGEELARHYAAADVFVFPSRTDTFGLVLLEALASGLPVAAYPVTGPLDLLAGQQVGALAEDLAEATRQALAIPRVYCRTYALGFSWRASATQFLGNLKPIRST